MTFQGRGLRRGEWWTWIAAGAAGLLTLLAALGVNDVVIGGPTPARPATTAVANPVALQELNRSIAAAETYLDGLYKPVGDGEAVQSETYGLPLRLYLPGYRSWVLLGAGGSGDCLTGAPCSGPTAITPLKSSRTTEGYRVTFDTPQRERAVVATVLLDWSIERRAVVTVQGLRSTDPRTGAQLWLDTVRLADVGAGAEVKRGFERTVVPSRSAFRSLRYSVRHATQAAYLWARRTGRTTEATALAGFLMANGYAPGADIRADVFGSAAGLGDTFPFSAAAYPDCQHLPAPGSTAYAYASKVCLAGVGTFLLAGRRDAFLVTSEALQVLADHGDPDARFPAAVSAGMDADSPRRDAAQLEAAWDRLGYGIPACTPAGCETTRASGLRTVEFGLLETILGYAYGDERSRSYADRVAARAVSVQVGQRGLIRTASGEVVRPVQAGSLPIFWDRSGRFVPTTGATAAATERLSMPPEFAGVSVSDSETTFDGWAFLSAYRCAKYRVGCGTAAWGEVLEHRS